MRNSKLAKYTGFFFIVLLVNTAYVAAFASPTVFYMTNVLFHLGLGVSLCIAVVILLGRTENMRHAIVTALGFFAISVVLAGYLVWAGNVTPNRWALWSHIAAAALGLAALIPYVWRKASENRGGWLLFKNAFVAALLFLVLFPAGMALYRRSFPEAASRI